MAEIPDGGLLVGASQRATPEQMQTFILNEQLRQATQHNQQLNGLIALFQSRLEARKFFAGHAINGLLAGRPHQPDAADVDPRAYGKAAWQIGGEMAELAIAEAKQIVEEWQKQQEAQSGPAAS